MPAKPGVLPPARRKDVVLLAVLAALVPLGYVLYTRHIWEDYFITFRHSQNLCEGYGLVYNPGERVHGFTSPLGVLLPAVCYVVTGKGSYLPALWLFRAASILAFATAGLLIVSKVGRPSTLHLAGYAFALLYAFDVKAVAFSVNGMETGFMLLFAGCCIFLWNSSHPKAWLARGLAWAGLMWTRPDGCIYIAAFSLAELVFAGGARRPLFRSLVQSAPVAAAAYLPWFLFAWGYYGSPVPQTISAKAPIEASQSVGALLGTLYSRLPHRAAMVFGPIYFPFFWPEPQWLYWFSYALGLFCLCYWLVPSNDRLGRTASLCFTLLCIYLSYMAKAFPWYLPSIGVCGLIVLARGVVTVAHALASSLRGYSASLGGAAAFSGVLLMAVIAGELGVFGMTVRQVKAQQEIIETGHRQQIGVWLRNFLTPGESVFLEPVGYIGYFSGATIHDWPGLVAPQVVALRHQGLDYAGVIDRLKPEWVILRPHEVELISLSDARFAKRYIPLKLFDVSDRLRAAANQSGEIPGEGYLRFDATFVVFKRASARETLPSELRPSSEESRDYLSRRLQPRHPEWASLAAHH